MKEETNPPPDLAFILPDLDTAVRVRDFQTMRGGEQRIPLPNEKRLRIIYTDNEEEKKMIGGKTAQEIEQEKWHTWTTSFMSVPSMYEEEPNHGGCCQCVPCCDCCDCCKCCQCCSPCLCALHPLGILRGALAPFIKLIKKYALTCGFGCACRDMEEDSDEGEEVEEHRIEQMEVQSGGKETKEGEVEMEEGDEGNWKRRFFKPCGTHILKVATRLQIDRDEEDNKASGGEERDEKDNKASGGGERDEEEKEENGERATKQHRVGIQGTWAPAKGTAKTGEEDNGEETEEEEVACGCCCCPHWRCPSLNPVTLVCELVGWIIRPLWKWMKNNPCNCSCIAGFGGEEEEEDSGKSEEMERERRLREYKERVEQRRLEKLEWEKREREELERKYKAREEWRREWEKREREIEIKGREEEKAREERVRAKRVREDWAQERAKKERAKEREKKEREREKRGREEEKVREERVRPKYEEQQKKIRQIMEYKMFKKAFLKGGQKM